MSQQSPDSGFAKAFVPGLVLGLVIGAFVGATLPPMLSGNKLPEHNPAAAGSHAEPTPRDEFPTEQPELETPPTEDPAADPGEETPTEEGAADDAGAGDDATPPADDGEGG